MTEEIETEVATEELEEESKGTVEDDVREALEALKTEGEDSTEEPVPAKDDKQADVSEEREEASETPVEKISPPERFNAKGKEWFNSLDPEGQEHVGKTLKDFERHYAKSWQEAAAAKKEAQEIIESTKAEYGALEEAIKPHLKTWGLKGLTPSQAITQLAAFQTMTMTDADNALLALAKSVGREIEIKNPASKPNAQAPQVDFNQAIENHPTVQQLRKELESQQQREIQAAIAPLAEAYDSGLEGLKNSINTQGRYAFPDLHDPEFVRTKVEPLATELAKSQPTPDAARDVLIRAYIASGGRVFLDPAAQNTAQPTRFNGKKHSEIAKRATLSTPSSRASSNMPLSSDIPEKAEDTVKLAMSMLGM